MSSRKDKEVWVLRVELPDRTTVLLFEDYKDAHEYGNKYYKDFQLAKETVVPTSFKHRKTVIKLSQDATKPQAAVNVALPQQFPVKPSK